MLNRKWSLKNKKVNPRSNSTLPAGCLRLTIENSTACTEINYGETSDACLSRCEAITSSHFLERLVTIVGDAHLKISLFDEPREWCNASFALDKDRKDIIQIPDPYYLNTTRGLTSEAISKGIEGVARRAQRLNPKVFWRGSTTGFHPETTLWTKHNILENPRVRICLDAIAYQSLDLKLTNVVQALSLIHI